jgi:hypothetical protein
LPVESDSNAAEADSIRQQPIIRVLFEIPTFIDRPLHPLLPPIQFPSTLDLDRAFARLSAYHGLYKSGTLPETWRVGAAFRAYGVYV